MVAFKSWQLTLWVNSKIDSAQLYIYIYMYIYIYIYIYSVMKKWEYLQLTLDNSKSKEGLGDYLDNTQIYSRHWEFDFF